MNTKQVTIRRKDGSSEKIVMPLNEIADDRYRFGNEDGANVPSLYLFHHEHKQSRLDLSMLENHLLISFDQEKKMVGITICIQTASGPFEVHNTQRMFLLVNRDQISDPAEIVSIQY